MKKLLFISSVLVAIGALIGITHTKQIPDPIVVVTIMIKNEEAVIRQTLEPFIDGGIDAFLVYDTGSTDNTIAVVEKLFQDRKIAKAHIVQEPFVDFSTSRNRALELAQQKFPNAAFMIMPDAEWYIDNARHLYEFCKKHLYDPDYSYLVRIVNPELEYYAPILIRCKTPVHFKGVVHETLNIPTNKRTPREVFFKRTLLAHEPGWEKSKKRYIRDRDLLVKDHQEHPDDARTVFYLAQTYSCMEDYENAYKYYCLRAQMMDKGWDQENYLTLYRLGLVVEKLSETNPNYTWPLALDYYLQAYNYRPCRVEPLVMIAQYYWNRRECAPCMLFCKWAIELPFPGETEGLMLESLYYTYHRYDILARCALCAGDYQLGQWAVEQALKNHPDDAHMKNMLLNYQKVRLCS